MQNHWTKMEGGGRESGGGGEREGKREFTCEAFANISST